MTDPTEDVDLGSISGAPAEEIIHGRCPQCGNSARCKRDPKNSAEIGGTCTCGYVGTFMRDLDSRLLADPSVPDLVAKIRDLEAQLRGEPGPIFGVPFFRQNYRLIRENLHLRAWLELIRSRLPAGELRDAARRALAGEEPLAMPAAFFEDEPLKFCEPSDLEASIAAAAGVIASGPPAETVIGPADVIARVVNPTLGTEEAKVIAGRLHEASRLGFPFGCLEDEAVLADLADRGPAPPDAWLKQPIVPDAAEVPTGSTEYRYSIVAANRIGQAQSGPWSASDPIPFETGPGGDLIVQVPPVPEPEFSHGQSGELSAPGAPLLSPDIIQTQGTRCSKCLGSLPRRGGVIPTVTCECGNCACDTCIENRRAGDGREARVLCPVGCGHPPHLGACNGVSGP